MQKILIISTSLYGGGAEKVLVTFLRNIDYSLFEVHLNLEYNYGISYEPIPPEVKITYRYKNTEDWRAKIDYHLYRLLRINIFEPFRIKNVVDKKYDAIISFVEGKPLKYHRYVAHRSNKNITWVHADMLTNHYTVGRTFSQKHEFETYKIMNRVVFVSENAKKQFEKLLGVGTTNNTVLYNPIDKDGIICKSKEQLIEKKKMTLVAIGRLSNEKGFDRLLRVARMLNDKGYDYDLWILGDGVMGDVLKGQKESLHLSNVKFLGFKNPPYSWLAQADIFINSSYTEAAPLVLCEAMLLGVPIVATKTSGAIELLENGKWGLLSEQNDISLFQSISSLFDSSEMLSYYKQRAIERASAFDIETSLTQFYSLITE